MSDAIYSGCEHTVDDLVTGPACLVCEVKDLRSRLDAILGMRDPWPLADVLNKLADGVTHMLTVHGCDTHGHEEYRRARDRALELRGAILGGVVEKRGTESPDACPSPGHAWHRWSPDGTLECRECLKCARVEARHEEQWVHVISPTPQTLMKLSDAAKFTKLASE